MRRSSTAVLARKPSSAGMSAEQDIPLNADELIKAAAQEREREEWNDRRPPERAARESELGASAADLQAMTRENQAVAAQLQNAAADRRASLPACAT